MENKENNENKKSLFEEAKPKITQQNENINPEIQLSEDEKQLIELQRQEVARLESFKEKYEKLVQETGFAWVVDRESKIGSPKIGIVRVN